MKWLLREPLLHFLLVGGALFAVHAALNSGRPAPASPRIEITQGDIEQLRQVWQSQWHRQPTSTELDGLISGEVRERLLAREAMEMGLDRDDQIVRRRLAQKLEFLIQDVSTQRHPTDEELAAFFAANPGSYVEPARLTISHIFFSVSKSSGAEERAHLSLERLRHEGSEAEATAASDPFLLELDFANRSLPEIEQLMGPEFTAALAKIPTGEWQGPVRSTYGWHLVKVTERKEERQFELAEVREKVQKDLIEAQRRKANGEAFERIRSRYEIVLPAREQSFPAAGQPASVKEAAR